MSIRSLFAKNAPTGFSLSRSLQDIGLLRLRWSVNLRELQDAAETLRDRREFGSRPDHHSLLPRRLGPRDPFLHVARAPWLTAIANDYGTPYLRNIHVWRDLPFYDVYAPYGTQLWHRDADDTTQLKAFLYLNDVDINGSPFCYIPGTHYHGRNHRFLAEADVDGRTADCQMLRHFPNEDNWMICTGNAGSLILADTSGYHRGLQPKRERLVLMIQWTKHRGAPGFVVTP